MDDACELRDPVLQKQDIARVTERARHGLPPRSTRQPALHRPPGTIHRPVHGGTQVHIRVFDDDLPQAHEADGDAAAGVGAPT